MAIYDVRFIGVNTFIGILMLQILMWQSLVLKDRKQPCLIEVEKDLHRTLQNCQKHILQQKYVVPRKNLPYRHRELYRAKCVLLLPSVREINTYWAAYAAKKRFNKNCLKHGRNLHKSILCIWHWNMKFANVLKLCFFLWQLQTLFNFISLVKQIFVTHWPWDKWLLHISSLTYCNSRIFQRKRNLVRFSDKKNLTLLGRGANLAPPWHFCLLLLNACIC